MTAPATAELTAVSATRLAALIRNRQVSATEVVDAHLRRIEDVNPVLHAVVQFDADRAFASAHAADEAIARGGEALGALHGVPFTVKDWIETEGLPCAAGIEERRDFIPKRDATAVGRLRAAGAILLGKTKPGNDDAVYPAPRNPYDVARSPGGSSGGEGAIIAAGGSPLGLGSDSGGSLRYPAHCCGIATIKPTAGLVPTTGHFARIGALSDPRTQIGPLSRHVEDLALTLPLIAGVDWRDPGVVPVPLRHSREVTLAGMRGAFYTAFEGAAPTSETAETVRRAALALEDAGAAIEEATPPRVEESLAITRAHWARLRSYSWSEWRPDGEPRLTGQEIERSIFAWERLQREMLRFVERYDVVLSPVSSRPAPPLREAGEEDFIYTLPYSLTGWPVAVIRCGTSAEGMPIGVQVIARPFRDDVSLAVAAHLETTLGAWQPPALGAY